MRRPPVPLQAVLAAVVLVAVILDGPHARADAQDCDVFPDAAWVASGAGVEFAGDVGASGECPPWRCGNIEYEDLNGDPPIGGNGLTTGRGCGEACAPDTAAFTCVANEYMEACSPPHNARCKACPQIGAEAAEGGYSFTPAGIYSKSFDILYHLGTFEGAKLYPPVLMVRNAVDNRVPGNSTPPDVVAWKDVMHPQQTSGHTMSWYGSGKIDLEHSTYAQGAHQSDVFMRLSAPTAVVMVCNMELSDGATWGEEDSTELQRDNNTRGLIFEFWYRQVMEYTNTVAFIAKLTMPDKSVILSRVISLDLAPTAEWTLVQGVFDYFETTKDIPQFGCLSLEFKMKERHEVQVDDLRVMRSLFANPFFFGWGDTMNHKYGQNGGWAAEKWKYVAQSLTGPAYVKLSHDGWIRQRIELPTRTMMVSEEPQVAATLSLYVRGEFGSMLYVSTNLWEGAAPDSDPVLNNPLYIIKQDLSGTTDTWTLVSVAVNLRVNTESDTGGSGLQSSYYFTISAQEGDVSIKSALLFVDDRRCPIHGCADPRTEVLVNGRCTKCTTTETCPPDEYQTGCVLSETKVKPICVACPTPHKENEEGTAPGEWVSEPSDRECNFQCGDGAWFQRGTESAGTGEAVARGHCVPCTAVATLRCPVGFYARACGREEDTRCMPCNDLQVSDPSAVYSAASRYNIDEYTKSKEIQCTHACAPGSFQYGVVARTSTPACFPCTTSVCGAEDNGISVLRLIDGLQYTSECTATADSRCQLCESDDANVVFTGSADRIGAWCGHVCQAGTTMCTGCIWNPSEALLLREHDPSVAVLGAVEFSDTLKLVRFAGSASILTAQFGTQLVVKMHIAGPDNSRWPPPTDAFVAVELFPLVPSAALASISAQNGTNDITGAPEQAFDAVVSTDERFRQSAAFALWRDGKDTLTLVYSIEMLGASTASATGLFNVSAFRVEAIKTTGAGCCDTPNSTAPDTVSPRGRTRCRACPGGHPQNAHWDRPNDCSWLCNQNYELAPGGAESTCEECFDPNCTEGLYWTECDTCASCIPGPDNSDVAGRGLTRYDNASCPFECKTGFYRTPDNLCRACTAASTLNCSTKPGGPYFEEVCTDTQDAFCLNCRVCPLGSYASTECSSHGNAVCSACDALDLGMPVPTADGGVGGEWTLGENTTDYCHWRCRTGLTHDTLRNTCVPCTEECASGYYPVPCTLANAFAPCLPCSIPERAVVLSSGTLSRNSSCAWTCASGDAYNRTSRECEAVPVPVAPTITTEPTAVACPKPSVCEFGYHLDSDALHGTPCAERCVQCDPPAPMWDETVTYRNPTVYTRKGSCAWVCRTPLMQVGEKCYPVLSEAPQ